MRIEIFAVDGGFGYRIVDEGENIHVEQPLKPGVEGSQLMTQAEAEQIAADVVAEMTSPAPPIVP